MRTELKNSPINRWPYRLAVLVAMVTFPLIWVGGLVTTYDAGMAVPDWPGTYGYNLFLYPWQTWISGPWDLFIEHGHRLLGALAGMVTIALLWAVYRWDRRRGVVAFAVFLLVAICLQGGLGGARVLLDERQLAMLHGCLGPAFYALCVVMVVVTSRVGSDASAVVRSDRAGWLHGLAWTTVGTAYVQLVLGALLRHVSATATVGYFRWTVFGHLLGAGSLVVLTGMLLVTLRKLPMRMPRLERPAALLAALIPVQILLGCATWVVNYYYPGWVPDWEITTWYDMIEAKGFLQTTIVTAHQAMGSLVLGTAAWLAARESARSPAFRALFANGPRSVRYPKMSFPSAVSLDRSPGLAARLSDYVELTKPRIATMVLVSVATAAFVARWGQPDGWRLLHALLGTLLVACSASALNQILERVRDGLMARTSDRPLPAGRLSTAEAIAFGILTGFGGCVYLALTTNWQAACWAATTWLLYVAIYTPLKGFTAANTIVGAVSGAMPVLIGWSAVGGVLDPRVDPRGWALFFILFLWQFPHFMAIAWMYRDDYARAGFQMLTVVDPSGRHAALQAVTSTLALLPVSLVPAALTAGSGAWGYLVLTAVLGLLMLGCAVRFSIQRSHRSARILLRSTLLYLPLVLACLVAATLQ